MTITAPVRALRISAALGAVLWIALRFAPTEAGHDPISRAMLLAVLVVVPLALALLPPSGARWSTWHTTLAIAQPLGALAAAASLSIASGPVATALASVFVSSTLLALCVAVVRLRAMRSRDAVEIGLAYALAMLPVAGVWLALSRTGVAALGLGPVTLLIAALHACFAGAMMPLLIALAMRRTIGRARRVLVGALVLAPIGAWLFVAADPLARLAGALALSLSLLAHAAVLAIRIFATLEGRLAKLALVFPIVSPLLSMPLALAAAIAHVDPSLLPFDVDLDWMVRVHGQANAHGVVTMGLLAYTLDRRAARSA